MTQQEIVLRYLDDQKDWLKTYSLTGIKTKWGFIGSQGDKRARELAKNQGYNSDGSLKKYFCYYGETLSGIKYCIEGDLRNGQRIYRARILTRDIPIVGEIKDDKITYYKPQGSPEQAMTGDLTINTLNDRLKAIRSEIKPSWENYEKLKRLDRVIAENNHYNKEKLIKSYA